MLVFREMNCRLEKIMLPNLLYLDNLSAQSFEARKTSKLEQEISDFEPGGMMTI
jgi:hypothetical protein